jgi:hypothetical protein
MARTKPFRSKPLVARGGTFRPRRPAGKPYPQRPELRRLRGPVSRLPQSRIHQRPLQPHLFLQKRLPFRQRKLPDAAMPAALPPVDVADKSSATPAPRLPPSPASTLPPRASESTPAAAGPLPSSAAPSHPPSRLPPQGGPRSTTAKPAPRTDAPIAAQTAPAAQGSNSSSAPSRAELRVPPPCISVSPRPAPGSDTRSAPVICASAEALTCVAERLVAACFNSCRSTAESMSQLLRNLQRQFIAHNAARHPLNVRQKMVDRLHLALRIPHRKLRPRPVNQIIKIFLRMPRTPPRKRPCPCAV